MTAILVNDLFHPVTRSAVCGITADRDGAIGARLHLLDLDNLHCGPYPSDRVAEMVRDDYRAIGFGSGDLVYTACNHLPVRKRCDEHLLSFHLAECWSPFTIRLANGPDGADHRLIADAETFLAIDGLELRFGDVVIGSGDHIFSEIAHRFSEVGLVVHGVVSQEDTLSRELRAEINGCLWLLPAGRCLTHMPWESTFS